MQAGFKLWREHHIYRALQLNPAKPFKCLRNYVNCVVRFAVRRCARMARMLGTIISDFKQFGFESLL